MFSKNGNRYGGSGDRPGRWIVGLAASLPFVLVSAPVAIAQDATIEEIEEVVVHGIRY
jgi:hypothetical protein